MDFSSNSNNRSKNQSTHVLPSLNDEFRQTDLRDGFPRLTREQFAMKPKLGKPFLRQARPLPFDGYDPVRFRQTLNGSETIPRCLQAKVVACCVLFTLLATHHANAFYPNPQRVSDTAEPTSDQAPATDWRQSRAKTKESKTASEAKPHLQIAVDTPWLSVPKFDFTQWHEPNGKEPFYQSSVTQPTDQAGHLSPSRARVISMDGISLAESSTAQASDNSEPEPVNEHMLSLFQAASEGEFPEGETGDFILDDILAVMRQNGSISTKLASSPGFDELESPLAKPLPSPPIREDTPLNESRNAKTAEQLLKAARLLEKNSPQSLANLSLIQEMRNTAHEMLSSSADPR